MEELTLERLLTDMRGVIDDIQKMVDDKNIDGARAFLAQVEELIVNDSKIKLDVIDPNVPPEEGQSYDHVLHQILSNINGVIEASREEQITEEVIDAKNKELIKAQAELKEAGDDEAKKKELKSKVDSLNKEIADLKDAQKELKKVKEDLEKVNKQIAEITGTDESNKETIDKRKQELKKIEEDKEANRKLIELLEKRKKEWEEEFRKVKSKSGKNVDELIEEKRKAWEEEQKKNKSGDPLDEEQKKDNDEKKSKEEKNLDRDYTKIMNELDKAYKERERLEKEEEKIKNEEKADERKEKLIDIEKELKEIDVSIKYIERRLKVLEIYKENTDYANLEVQLEGLIARRRELTDERKKIELEATDITSDDKSRFKLIGEQKYLEEEIESLNEKLEELNNKLQRDGGNGREATVEEIIRVTDELNLLKNQLKKNKNKLAKIGQGQEQEGSKQDKLKELIQKREELENRKKELEGKLRKETTKTITDRLDLKAEARRMGENIFNAHEIIKEIENKSRNITREDLIAFYEEGQEITEENIKQAKKIEQTIIQELTAVFIDKESNVSLYEQAMAKFKDGDREAAIPIYEKIRQNMLNDKSSNDRLKKLELEAFITNEITQENLEEFVGIVESYSKDMENSIDEQEAKIKDQQENYDILKREIERIKEEQKNIELAQMSQEELAEKSKNEKELRARQIRASMYGNDPELQEEWDERFSRFYGNRETAEEEFTYIDQNGEKRSVKYETIKEYEEYKDDAFFLNLEEYKKNLELTTKFRASQNDPYSLTSEMIQAYEEAEAKEQGSGQKLIESMIQDMEEYVTSFHGNVNEHAVKYATYKTAGSALKAMKPVKGVSPATVKYASAIENVGRFFGIRPPKFSRINENGEKVRDIKGGILTLATDALVIGVAGAAVMAGPIAMATWGAAYAAKGIVIGGYQLAARREMRKYGDEIRSNLPTPFKSSRDAKEVARKEYYRTHDKEGNLLLDGKTNGKLSTWFKAKADKYIFRGRKARTEEAIVEERIANSDKTIDARDAEAKEVIKQNLEKADRNLESAKANLVESLKGSYDRIVGDPGSVDIETATKRSAINGVLQSKGKEGLDINPNSTVPRREKFIKDLKFTQTEDLDEVITEGGSIASTAVTESQKRLGEQQKVDRHRKVWTAILTGGFHAGIKGITQGYQTVTQDDPTTVTTRNRVIGSRPKTEQVTSTDIDTNKTLGEYITDGAGAKNTYGATGTGANATTSTNIDSVALRTGDIEVSVTETGVFTQAGKHVHAALSQGTELSDMNIEQLVETLQTADPSNFTKYLNATGLQNASTSEIAKYMIENGQLYFQTGGKGWNLVDSSNLVENTTDVITGFEKYFKGWATTTKEVAGDIHTTTDPRKILAAIGKGVIAGATVAGVDDLHEAAHQTQPVDRGTHEDKTPTSRISKLLKLEQEKENQRRREQDNQDLDQEDEEQDNQDLDQEDDGPEL